MHEADLRFNVKASLSGGAKWKEFLSDPWRLAKGDVLQGAASPHWRLVITSVFFGREPHREIGCFSSRNVLGFPIKVWVWAAHMRLKDESTD